MTTQGNIVYNKSHAHRIDFRSAKRNPEMTEMCQDWKLNFLRCNPWLVNIPEDYISDRFNVFGLNDEFQFFLICCDIINGKTNLNAIAHCNIREIREQLPYVYGMIHARYILSPEGLNAILDRYKTKVYGTCPRVYCQDEALLPIGPSSKLNESKVKTFCPVCREIFEPRPKIDLDGAFFGPNMAHIFIDEMKLMRRRANYVPFNHNAFGFRIRSPFFGTAKPEEEEEDEGEGED
ncbi:Casein kinase II subunit beta [Tritrichomonas foetus]|uniref:Casein kinase II subunit beta n=1 Tax=Tritrichomonas foetus TaxID=1144522 RepID=A0A1J4KFX0_9EUKA|nr:Casein kinase II subunit beta [Tritrichomonas foetus]|eukprot:OHT08534.1 Casein kinase II subunit beta [Tritrichomonas foetus]